MADIVYLQLSESVLAEKRKVTIKRCIESRIGKSGFKMQNRKKSN